MDTGTKRPQGITVVAVVGFLFAAFALCGNIAAVAGAFMQKFTQETLGDLQSGLPNADAQLEMQQEIIQAGEALMPFQICFGVIGLLVTFFLIAALGALLAGKAPAPKAVKVACGIAAFVALAEGAFTVYSQYAVSGAMSGMMNDMPEGAAGAAEGIMGASMALGICWGLVWMCIKLGYYIGSIVYLSKQEVLRDYAAASALPLSVRGE